jgi:hypothetical protein
MAEPTGQPQMTAHYCPNIAKKWYALNRVASDRPALHCTCQGYIPCKSPTGEILSDTFISPTDVVNNHLTNFHAWDQCSNIDTGTGYI